MISDHEELISFVTLTDPLGPDNHERMANTDEVISKLLYDKIPLFSEILTKPHMLFLGRKGSGKSSLLSEIRLGAQKSGRRGYSIQDDEPRKKRDYIICVCSWEHFNQIVRNVTHIVAHADELTPSEYFVKIWYETLWDEIIQYFYNYYGYDDECRRVLKPIHEYVNVDGLFEGSAHKHAENLFKSAKAAVLEFIKQRESRIFFLFDSMDYYPVRKEKFLRIVTGLFQGLTKVSDESHRIIVSFCMPEEIMAFISPRSSNLMKDMASSYKIRWSPTDLIKIVAHRLRVSASIYDPTLFLQLKELDFAKRDDLHRAFSLVLPERLKNSYGTDEDPLAYIIRHTQLLPRHILAIFNLALSHHYKAKGTFMGMSEEAVRKGVSDAQFRIANHILNPFQQELYPSLIGQCKKILPDLEPICDYNKLKKTERRFDRVIEHDVTCVWETLFEMGILGRSTDKSGTDSHALEQSDRYCYGQFYYNIDRGFGLATDGEYCFHPIFARYFGMMRRNDDKRVVYPAQIDLHNIYG